MTRATVRLTLDCDNRCVFCAQDGLSDSAGAPAPAEVVSSLRSTSDELTFLGGEPTLHPDLPALVSAARAAGFRRIGLQTNGRRLAEPGFARALKAAGLTDVHLSVHGAEPALHDHLTGVEGALDRLLLGLGAAIAESLEVVVATVVTRSNFRHLGALPRMLKSAGVAGWLVSMPRVAGRAAPAFDRLVPRLALAAPFALHALESAQRLGLPAWIQGAPACLLGPFAARMLDEAPRAYAAPCGGCPARATCPGVDPVYLQRFSGDELRARDAVPPAPGFDAIRRMFVGVGELAAGPLPAHLRRPAGPRALTVLGKPG